MSTNGDNLLLIVEAANILEQRRKRSSCSEPGDNSLNGCSQVGSKQLKGNKKRKLQVAQAPTTVELLEVNTYAVNIERVENPFAEDDKDSDNDSDDVSGHHHALKFHTTKSVSHAKMIHNAKEKKRRRSLKQAQLALHQELQPYTHQKPILRTILCSAIEEIKKLKNIAEENESSLAMLRNKKQLLTEKLELLNSLEQSTGDTERGSSNNSYENDDCVQQSMECDSVVDVTENDSSEQYIEHDRSKENENREGISSTNNTECAAADGDQSSLFTNSLLTSPLYCTAAAQLAALQAQSIQLAQLQTFTNPIWLPPLVWPNLNSLYSNVTGNQLNGTNNLYEKQHFNGVNGHARKEVGSESYCSAVKCSVVKTTGNVDKKNQPCNVSLNLNTTFHVDSFVETL